MIVTVPIPPVFVKELNRTIDRVDYHVPPNTDPEQFKQELVKAWSKAAIEAD